jgi:phage terminase large subunit
MTDEDEELVSPYVPRAIFKAFHRRRQRWAIAVAHRRAGKTVACINDLVMSALACRRPNPRFAYVAPYLNQAKDIAWTYLKDFTRFLPGCLVRETELSVELPGGARIRLYGADNPDRLRGIYLDGVVLDEFGDMDPGLWTRVLRPMLSDERRGWATFIGTPKGKNHFHRLWAQSETDDDWYRLELKASRTGLLDAKELAAARRDMSDDDHAQEYECSFEAAVRGAYYAKPLIALEQADPPQVTSVPHDPRLPVHTAWDLGVADSTVIWFFQVNGRETRVIDVLKGEGVGLEWYANALKARPESHGRAADAWVWGGHYLPHDAEVRELGTGKTRVEVLAGYGIAATICPSIPSRTASRPSAASCPPAGSTGKDAARASRRCACIAATMTSAPRSSKPVRATTGPAITPTLSAISRWPPRTASRGAASPTAAARHRMGGLVPPHRPDGEGDHTQCGGGVKLLRTRRTPRAEGDRA